MTRGRAYVGLGLLVAIAMLLASSDSSPAVVWQLTYGWIGFSQRVLPQVHLRLDGIAIAVCAYLLASLCFHQLATWWLRHQSTLRPNIVHRTWRFRSSLMMVLIFAAIFVVGIAMAGVVHQAGWIATSPGGMAIEKIQPTADASLAQYRPNETPARASWLTACAPYVPFLIEDYDPSLPFNHPSNAAQFRGVVPSAICPSQGNPLFSPDGFGLSHVAANPSALGGKITDKNTQAIMLGEVNAAFDPWGFPGNQREPDRGIRSHWQGSKQGTVGYGSLHGNGANFAILDGTVKYLRADIDPRVLQQLSKAQ